jgi:hypothetical protein
MNRSVRSTVLGIVDEV